MAKTEIIEKPETLPTTIEELISFVIVGNEAVKAWKNKMRAVDKANIANEAYKQSLCDGQKMGELVLLAEAKLGELLINSDTTKSSSRGTSGKFEGGRNPLPVGINKKESHYAREIYRFPNIVHDVVANAIDKNDIATRHEVLKKIRKKKKEIQREKKSEEGKKIKLKNIDFRLGDFTEVLDDIPDGSVDLILTDPPYPIEFIDCWSKLADFAYRKLKKNGFCIAYSGQKNLPEVMKRMDILDYYWMFALIHKDNKQLIDPRNIFCGWKPILIYQNGFKKLDIEIEDIISGTGRSKKDHDWEQSLGELKILLTSFSNKGDVVVDPFAGSGTVLIASKKLKRVPIGAEQDEKTFNIAKKRIDDELG